MPIGWRRNTLGKPSEQSEEVQGGVNPPLEGKIDLPPPVRGLPPCLT